MKSVLDQSKLADLKILDGKLYIPKQRDSFFETINEKLFSECSIWKASLEKGCQEILEIKKKIDQEANRVVEEKMV